MWVATPVTAQQQSVRPGINDAFRDPDVTEFVGKFETESREVFALRKEIVGACELKPGQTVADVGAGTGLFTDLFAEAVGTKGRVIAVDISQKFVDHIREKARAQGRLNIDALLCSADSVELPPESIDVAFICDTYHHFEFPFATMKSLAKAMKPGGVLVVIDFRRIEGV
ncbi:MAG: class I SAM-dependent methyltransferase, partial [Planctomycetes bacterium]|nr:class I SAM-dependent methyltransferase [Planctomycetota bacterium]